ncbi:MAG: homoserine dehydrogenase [Chloroflexi bacterium]|mgnify:FL=1|nr:homoserine dehydrogenase [Chloroflexota bacterium]MDC0047314.1 homoserine dehydrogenase [Chloroflexota bacterium]|tara:strand:- start:58 stop:1344 length:1287 start_codon:yes stop_codon:yes gene_type:complete
MSDMIEIGILGMGNIGSEFVEILQKQTAEIEQASNKKIQISKILVSNLNKKRNTGVNDNVLTTNPDEIFKNENISIVIELMGGVDPAFEYVSKCLDSKKSVITANKDLIATHGKSLFQKAKSNNVSILFEAAVASGTPIISTLIRDLSYSNINSIRAIINGTSNFILSEMEEKNTEFDDALQLAQKLGYAEPDPTNDVEGYDARYKLAILSSLSFNTEIEYNKLYVEGISNIDSIDFQYAKELGYSIKLLAIAEKDKNNILARVHPTMIDSNSPLAKISGAMNAVEIKENLLGTVIIQGPGAGPSPTSSGLLSDLINILKNSNNVLPSAPSLNNKFKVLNIDYLESRFYLRFIVKDKAGVLSKMSNILGEENISIASVIQKENVNLDDNYADLVFMTYKCTQSSVNKALEKISKLSIVKTLKSMIRVE